MHNALSCEAPDDTVPVWEIEFHLFNKASARRFIICEEYSALTAAEKDKALHDNAEIMCEVAADLGMAALTNIDPYWEVVPGVPAPFWLPEEDSYRFLPLLKKQAGDEIFIIQWCHAMIGMPGPGDYEEFAYKLFDSPEEIDTLARQRYERGMEIARAARDAGTDGLCAACDIADNHGPYFTDEQMQRYFLPYLDRWAREVHRLGMKTILHSDGNLAPVIESLAGTELDALQAIDPVAGMDIVETKRRVEGRLCVCGNVDLKILASGPPDAIRDAVAQICLGCKTDGGFVLGATNAVFQDIPLDHYRAMLDAGREFGSYAGDSKGT
jgi:hypothetical protein